MRELIVGIVFIIGVTLLVYSVIWVSESVVPGKTHLISVYFDNVDGLEPKSVVRFMGVEVGRVESISFENINVYGEETLKVMIQIRIQHRHLKWIKEDSEFFINMMGVVGKKYVEITSGSVDAMPLDPRRNIIGKNPFQIGRTLSKLEDIAFGVDMIVKEATGAMSSIRKASSSTSDVMNRVKRGQGLLGKMVQENSRYERDVNTIVQDMDRAMRKLNLLLDKYMDQRMREALKGQEDGGNR